MAKAKTTTKTAAKKAATPAAKKAVTKAAKPAAKAVKEEKTKKPAAKTPAKAPTKAPAKAAKAPVKAPKAASKPVSKAPAKATPKTPVKAASKSPAKSVAKPAAKAASKVPVKAVPKAPAKAASKQVTKTSAKPAPKTPVKAATAPAKKAEAPAAKKAATKAVKPAPKAPAKAPAKKITYFAVNEHVVYPIQGVGEIKAIEKRIFREKEVLYYEIYFETPDMTVMMPVENADSIGLRKIVSSKEALKALELLNQEYEQSNTDWKTRNQQNLELLKKGTISDIARVVKTLYDRSISKELPIQERKLYDNASKLLIDEVSLALKKTKKESEAMIFEKLELNKKPVLELEPEMDPDSDLELD